MDTALTLSALLTAVRISGFALLCWGGWMLYSHNYQETKPAQDVGLQRVGVPVLFALLWATFEGVAR